MSRTDIDMQRGASSSCLVKLMKRVGRRRHAEWDTERKNRRGGSPTHRAFDFLNGALNARAGVG